MVSKSAKIMVLQTHKNLKRKCSTFSIQHAIAYSISWSKAEKEIDLFQDGGKIKKAKNIDHNGPDPRTFPLVSSFKVHKYKSYTRYGAGIEKGRSGR